MSPFEVKIWREREKQIVLWVPFCTAHVVVVVVRRSEEDEIWQNDHFFLAPTNASQRDLDVNNDGGETRQAERLTRTIKPQHFAMGDVHRNFLCKSRPTNEPTCQGCTSSHHRLHYILLLPPHHAHAADQACSLSTPSWLEMAMLLVLINFYTRGWWWNLPPSIHPPLI